MISSDYQEAKNIDTIGPSIMPNTRSVSVQIRVVAGVAVDWLEPEQSACVLQPRERLVVAASGPRGIATVRFAIDGRRVAVVRKGDQGLWFATVSTRGLARGSHTITVVAADDKGHAAAERRGLRVCHG